VDHSFDGFLAVRVSGPRGWRRVHCLGLRHPTFISFAGLSYRRGRVFIHGDHQEAAMFLDVNLLETTRTCARSGQRLMRTERDRSRNPLTLP